MPKRQKKIQYKKKGKVYKPSSKAQTITKLIIFPQTFNYDNVPFKLSKHCQRSFQVPMMKLPSLKKNTKTSKKKHKTKKNLKKSKVWKIKKINK
jgi:hypothetical protein